MSTFSKVLHVQSQSKILAKFGPHSFSVHAKVEQHYVNRGCQLHHLPEIISLLVLPALSAYRFVRCALRSVPLSVSL